jgi:hypothetical protein
MLDQIIEFFLSNYIWIITGVFIPILVVMKQVKSNKWKQSIAREEFILKQKEFSSKNKNRIFWQSAAKVTWAIIFILWLFSGKK